MENLDFSKYCAQFLEDSRLGDLPFFKEEAYTSSYRDLITLSLSLSKTLKKEPGSFYALKIESPYFFFAHLLASLFAHKNALILSDKEPENAIKEYQKTLSFNRVITGVIGSSEKSESFPSLEIPLENVAFSILSSGSSGPSKAILLSIKNIYASSKSLIDFFQMNENDTTFMNLPHHHIGGMMIFWRAFFSMSSITNISDSKYNFISLVPLQLKRSLDDALKLEQLKSCRGVLIGGAPLSEELKKEALKFKIPVYETYGMSETSSMVMLNGWPLKNQSIKLDSEGHFLIKGPTLSPNAPLDKDGYFHTKDIGKIKEDGSFVFLHRSDILFKSSGELIDPLAVEKKVKELQWILEAVSVPVHHHEWGKAQVLVYKSSDPTKNADDIKVYLKKEVHPYMVPRFFYEAPKDLFTEGMKPKRFLISNFAKETYLKSLFHYLYIPHENAKKLVVFFHGFMEDHTDMISLMDNHHESSYLFIDFPGHGKSKISSFKKREDVFSYLSELITHAAQNKEYVLYGYSMGGRVALELSLDYLRPSLLILESAHFGLSSFEEKRNRMESDRSLFSNVDDLKTFFESWYKNPIFAKYNESSHYELEIEKKLSHSKTEWQHSLEFISPGASPYLYSEVIAKLKMLKVVGITGSEDLKYKNHFADTKEHLVDLHLFEIKEAGHNPHKTHVSEVKAILSRFI